MEESILVEETDYIFIYQDCEGGFVIHETEQEDNICECCGEVEELIYEGIAEDCEVVSMMTNNLPVNMTYGEAY